MLDSGKQLPNLFGYPILRYFSLHHFNFEILCPISFYNIQNIINKNGMYSEFHSMECTGHFIRICLWRWVKWWICGDTCWLLAMTNNSWFLKQLGTFGLVVRWPGVTRETGTCQCKSAYCRRPPSLEKCFVFRKNTFRFVETIYFYVHFFGAIVGIVWIRVCGFLFQFQ